VSIDEQVRADPDLDDKDDVARRDIVRLHQLGYAQELRRRMSGFSNFAVSFSIISVLTALTIYGYGLGTGGPADLVWGYLLVGILVIVVGSGMAEICSSYPTSGGLYYWAGRLGGRNGPAWSWFTGWFNVLGQVAVTAGIDFGFATFFLAFLNLTTGLTVTTHHQLIVYGLALLVHASLNTFGIRVVAFLADVSAWWHLAGVAVITIVLLVVPAHHASLHYVFATFKNQTHFRSGVYVFFIGLLFAQYNFTGYDASAHMTEETHDAALAGPRGIVSSIVISLVAGLILIIDSHLSPPRTTRQRIGSSTGVPPLQIFLDALGTSRRRAALRRRLRCRLLLRDVLGDRQLADHLRLLPRWGPSRLGLSGVKVNQEDRARPPTRSGWRRSSPSSSACPTSGTRPPSSAITSLATIGLYIAYGLPILLRRIHPGELRARALGTSASGAVPVGWVAVVWVALITVLFCLPEVSPVTLATHSITRRSQSVSSLFSLAAWWLLSARKWFKGPHRQGDEAKLKELEEEIGGLKSA
jgi:hypothetical protein